MIIIINVIKTVAYYVWYFYLCLWTYYEGFISLGGTLVITVDHILDFVLILMLKKAKAQIMLEQITFP